VLFHLHTSSGHLRLIYMIWISAYSSVPLHLLLFVYTYLLFLFFVVGTRRNEGRRRRTGRGKKKRRGRRLTQVVPPVPVTVVVKQQYPLLHLQSLELSIVLQVSFLQLPFVIVYPQPTVSGIGAKPDISSVPIIFA
jgi:hypothetical protein